MKKRAIVISLALLLLLSCEKSNIGIDEVEVEAPRTDDSNDEIEVDNFKTLELDAARFHFVVGWLNDAEIVFVEKEESIYLLKKINVETGETATLYNESMIIIDAKIHPTKERILLHTSSDSSSATVKVISLEGIVLDEISIASIFFECALYLFLIEAIFAVKKVLD